MTANTQEAKTFLGEHFPELEAGKWKRTRKHKDANGNWVRDFEHVAGERVSLVEKEGVFQIAHDGSTQPKNAMFSEEELSGARQLLEDFRKAVDSHDDDAQKAVERSTLRAKFGHALPGVMSFYFPPDTYENCEVEEFDISMPAKKLWITFFETDKGFMDGGEYYYQWMIPSRCLPRLDRGDETNFEILDDEGSVAEFIAKMQARGFTYCDEECIFGSAMENSPQEIAILAPPRPSNFLLHSKAMEAIEADDVDALAILLGQGLEWNTQLGDERTLLGLAMDCAARSCFELMLARVKKVTDDIENHAARNLHLEGGQEPEHYYLPLLSAPWAYGDKGGMGDKIVRKAVFWAMEPLGPAVTGPMLDLAKGRGTPQQFAGSLLRVIATHPLSMRTSAVKQRVEEAIKLNPSVLVDESTSPIGTMVHEGRYGMAGDWIVRHKLPVEALRVEGRPLVEYLEEQLKNAQARVRGRAGQPFRVIKTTMSGQHIPDREDVDVRDIPGLLGRLARTTQASAPIPRSPRP